MPSELWCNLFLKYVINLIHHTTVTFLYLIWHKAVFDWAFHLQYHSSRQSKPGTCSRVLFRHTPVHLSSCVVTLGDTMQCFDALVQKSSLQHRKCKDTRISPAMLVDCGWKPTKCGEPRALWTQARGVLWTPSPTDVNGPHFLLSHPRRELMRKINSYNTTFGMCQLNVYNAGKRYNLCLPLLLSRVAVW